MYLTLSFVEINNELKTDSSALVTSFETHTLNNETRIIEEKYQNYLFYLWASYSVDSTQNSTILVRIQLPLMPNHHT